jgi:hypothetical protein
LLKKLQQLSTCSQHGVCQNRQTITWSSLLRNVSPKALCLGEDIAGYLSQ